MVWTKGCPRCRGDLVRMDDDYEPYLSCLQCGHTIYRNDDRQLAANLMSEGEAEAEPATVEST